MTENERITAWILTGVSASLAAVIIWWLISQPNQFIQQGLGVTDELWRMPLVWVFSIVIALGYITYTAWAVPVVRKKFFTMSRLKVVGILVAITSGIVEEVIFRHFLMDMLADNGNSIGIQIAFSALAFGVAHIVWVMFSGDKKNIIYSILSTIILGALLAWLYILADRSTLPSIVAHVIINLGIEPWLILNAVSRGKYGASKVNVKRTNQM